MRGVAWAWVLCALLACSGAAGGPQDLASGDTAGEAANNADAGESNRSANEPATAQDAVSHPTVDAGRGADAGLVTTSWDAQVPSWDATLPDGAAAAPDVGAPDLNHTFDPIQLEPFEEVTALCQSWTVGNAEPIWVHTVRSENEGAVHHSNWIWVTDDLYPGEDGTWPCAERGFDQVLGGAAGGVFFAQSTQSRSDEQRFPDGVAFEVPPHARIIGDVHLLNTSDQPTETRIHFDVFALPVSDVEVALKPMAFTNLALDIAPGSKTVARMQCALPQPDLDIYYILPHFHSLGMSMTIDVAGGPLDGSELWRSTGTYGEPLGETFDAPLHVTGAAGLGITCEYENPGAEQVVYGFGDQEMCVVLIYSDGAKAGGAALANLTTDDSNGAHRTDALCVAVSTP